MAASSTLGKRTSRGIVKLRRIYPFCDPPAPKREINALEVAEQSLNRVKQLNLTIPLCHLCHTARIDTRTIVLKCHTNIPESKNAKCAAFVLMDMRNDS